MPALTWMRPPSGDSTPPACAATRSPFVTTGGTGNEALGRPPAEGVLVQRFGIASPTHWSATATACATIVA